MLGAAWLALKADGPTAEFARRVGGRKSLFATILFIGIASLATPLLNPTYYERWFVWPGISLSVVMPVLVLAAGWAYLRDIKTGAGLQAYLAGWGYLGCALRVSGSQWPLISCRIRSRSGRPPPLKAL